MTPLPLIAYRWLTRMLEPLAPRLLDARVRRGKEDEARVDERLGIATVARPPGDLVWLHVHSTNGAGDRGRAIVDIFRVENGRIAEHWDVVQPVPEKSANGNTMF